MKIKAQTLVQPRKVGEETVLDDSQAGLLQT